MLGVSFAKIVVLVAVVAAVWFGVRWLRVREEEARTAATKTPTPQQPEAQDLRRCSTCGAYAATRCSRRSCAL